MKKRVWLLGLACVALAGVGVLVFSGILGKRPYKNLQAEQIQSARVHMTPPDKTVEITDLQELVTCLQDIVIYQKDSSYTEYTGQGVVFTLSMADGTQTEVMTYNPFIVIDGVGYRTKYEPCEALNHYANGLLE